MQVSLPHWTPGLWRFRLESCIGRCLLLCGLCACVSGRSIAESPTLEEASNSKVWVYSLVGTNYDGYKMLPFFLQHYRGLGIPDSQFHFDVLHDPDEPEHGLNVSLLPRLLQPTVPSTALYSRKALYNTFTIP